MRLDCNKIDFYVCSFECKGKNLQNETKRTAHMT